jgi:hypothetical protein
MTPSNNVGLLQCDFPVRLRSLTGRLAFTPVQRQSVANRMIEIFRTAHPLYFSTLLEKRALELSRSCVRKPAYFQKNVR